MRWSVCTLFHAFVRIEKVIYKIVPGFYTLPNKIKVSTQTCDLFLNDRQGLFKIFIVWTIMYVGQPIRMLIVLSVYLWRLRYYEPESIIIRNIQLHFHSITGRKLRAKETFYQFSRNFCIETVKFIASVCSQHLKVSYINTK